MKTIFTLYLTVACFGLFAQETEQILWQMIDNSPEEMKSSASEGGLMSKLLTETLTCTFFFDANDNNITLEALELLGAGEELELYFPGFYLSPVDVPELEISGAVIAEEYTSETYSYPGSNQSEFEWIVTGGAITSGQGTAEIDVFWGQSGNGSIAVTETLNGLCPGELVAISVVIMPESEEILGCTDPQACNYIPDATIDNGSCEYVELYTITGNLTPELFTSEVYSYQETAGSTYQWSTTIGAITAGQGTNEVSITWGTQGTGQLCVTETREEGCLGEEVCENIVVLPTDVEEKDGEAIVAFPNPASMYVTVSGVGSWLAGEYEVFDLQGRVVLQGTVNRDPYVFNVSELTSGRYELVIRHGEKLVSHSLVILK